MVDTVVDAELVSATPEPEESVAVYTDTCFLPDYALLQAPDMAAYVREEFTRWLRAREIGEHQLIEVAQRRDPRYCGYEFSVTYYGPGRQLPAPVLELTDGA